MREQYSVLTSIYKLCVCVCVSALKKNLFSYKSLLTAVNLIKMYHSLLINKNCEGSKIHVKFPWQLHISCCFTRILQLSTTFIITSDIMHYPGGKGGECSHTPSTCFLHSVQYISFFWLGGSIISLRRGWFPLPYHPTPPGAITLLYSAVVQLTTLSPPCIIWALSFSLSLFFSTHTILIIFHF